jgi:hypothetical protein
VIASGGLAGLDDIRALLQPQYAKLEGAITGRALYDGRLDARQRLRALSPAHRAPDQSLPTSTTGRICRPRFLA